MGDKVKVRIPFLENLATQYGSALSKSSRELTSAEKDIVTPIFEQSVLCARVRIVIATAIAAPTTLGNNIRIPPGYSLKDHVLVHEMTHIWQFQTKGNAYISDSLLHQAAAVLSGGDRNAAYNYEIVKGKSIYDYTAEQQAMIVEDFFKKKELQDNDEYKRLIAQVRSARPTLTDQDRYIESLYGQEYKHNRFFDPLPSNQKRETDVASVVRIEF